MAENLPLSSVDVMESGGLNLPEPPGPHRLVMGMIYPIYICMVLVIEEGTPNYVNLRVYVGDAACW
jgi:hypothetical protein